VRLAVRDGALLALAARRGGRTALGGGRGGALGGLLSPSAFRKSALALLFFVGLRLILG